MTTTPLRSFADFGVEEPITQALADSGISTPFPIQELTLPLALSGADIIGQARTGTGKTLAFGIPLLSRVDPDASYVQALVIVPTRELCLQVTGDLQQAGARKGVDVVAVYGGRSIEPQTRAIAGGAAVVVGTPGRLLDLMRRGTLKLGRVTSLVLDEADEMLDLGFLPDVEQLIQATSADRQTLLFSATMPSQVVALARRYMSKPTFLRADVEEVRIAPETTQYFFSCHRMDKPAVLARILQTPHLGLCLVFTRTRRMADILAEELRGRGIQAAPIHSDLRQEARERALGRFRRGKLKVLVATEVAARGLDIDDVTHVVNYDCPDDEKMYLHRVGRTGRAGAAGVAVTLAVWNELARLEMIKRALDITDETHEVFSTSPILDELFDLPPRAPRQPVIDDEPDDEDDEPQHENSQVTQSSERDSTPRPRRRRSRSRGRSSLGDDARGGDGAPADAARPAEPAAEAEETVSGNAEPRQVSAPPKHPFPESGVEVAEPAPAAAAAPVGTPEDEQPLPERKKRRRSRLRNPFARRRREEEEQAAAETSGKTQAEASTAGRAEVESAQPVVTREGEVSDETVSEWQAEAGTPQQPVLEERTPAEGGPRVRVRRRGRRGDAATAVGPDQITPAEAPAHAGAGAGDDSGAGGRRPASAGQASRSKPKPSNRKSANARNRRADRDGRRGGVGSPNRRSAHPQTTVDAATARGQGKPMLQRPLTIAHLP